MSDAPRQYLLHLLAAVIGAYLLVALAAVVACIYFEHRCEHVDFRYWLGEPLAAILGLLAGRATSGKE